MDDYKLGSDTVRLPGAEAYRLEDGVAVHTPALLIYPDFVDRNIASVLRVLGGDANRWRPHVKTAKLALVMRRLVSAGVRQFKCATTLELRVACEAGADDVLVAYPLVGPRAARVIQLAAEFATVRISALIERPEAVEAFAGSRVGLFVDVNPGADRTGIPDTALDRVAAAAGTVQGAGLEFRGLHYYDGHMSAFAPDQVQRVAHEGYDRLLRLIEGLEARGLNVEEVITAGTPALCATASYARFRNARFVHRASPGTVVYSDATSAAQVPREVGLSPAALVATTVVSHPAPGIVTCDAGHKTVSADAGVPTCVVLGRPDLQPLKPSEEHLPVAVPAGSPVPAVGDILYLLPRHVCPTVNNFDLALIVAEGKVIGVEPVSARGREAPLGGLSP